MLGVGFALVAGKPIGVVGATWLAVRLGWCRLAPGVSWGGICLVGLLAGWFAMRIHSMPAGLIVGLALGTVFAFVIAAMQQSHYWEIMLPGSVLGLIVGYATQRYGRGSPRTSAVVAR